MHHMDQRSVACTTTICQLLHHPLHYPQTPKTLNRPKEMNAVSTKALLRFFSSSLPICPVYFHFLMPRHVLSPCYVRYEHTRGIKGYVTYYWAWHVRLQVQNMYEVTIAKHAWVSLEKIWMRQMGRLEEKIAAALLYWLHSFHLAWHTPSLLRHLLQYLTTS